MVSYKAYHGRISSLGPPNSTLKRSGIGQVLKKKYKKNWEGRTRPTNLKWRVADVEFTWHDPSQLVRIY